MNRHLRGPLLSWRRRCLRGRKIHVCVSCDNPNRLAVCASRFAQRIRRRAFRPTQLLIPHPKLNPLQSCIPAIVGGSAIALLWLLSSDLRATQCGAPSKPQPTTLNGRSGIWRHNYTVWMACPTAKTTRIKLTRPSPGLVYHCNDAISRIQEGPCPWCTQARSLSARNGEDSSRPASAVYHSNRAGEFCL